MIRPAQILRLIHINFVLVRHGLDEIILATHLFRPFRFLYYMAPWNWVPRRREPRAVRIRSALEELGPIYVKFGQILSTRRDLLPDDIAQELAQLQDNVPPFPGSIAKAQIEAAFGKPVNEVFRHFDETPLASASIAQVHTARLQDGKEVIIKVLRPNVRQHITRDIRLLHTVARLAERYWKDGHRLRPREVVSEFEKTLYDELDLLREAANASQLRRNFSGSDLLYVPEVYWPYCRPEVMVMERISGIQVSDIDSLRANHIDLKRLSERGVEIFFTQVFRHNFFHADMHPGNIFVDATDPGNPGYIAVDFGIVGSLDPRDQQYLAENFLAFFQRDYHRVARLHINSGWVPRDTRLDEVESAFRTVCEPIFNRPLSEISFGQFLVRLFTVARRFGMEVQPQLILLQKTLLNIEGLGRELYPELDLWETAQPILEEWMSERVSGRAIINRLREQIPNVGESLQEFPQVVHGLLQKASEGQLEIKVSTPGIDDLRRENREIGRRQSRGIAGAATLVASAVLLGLGAEPAWLGWAAGVVAVWLLINATT